MKNILITGNAGFIGSHLADEFLVSKHFDVYGMDNLSGGFKRNIQRTMKFHYTVSLEDPTVHQYIQDIKPDVLLYLAADAREGRSQFTPISATKNNIMAYVNTLTACIKAGVKKVVFFSSMSVYGGQKTPFSEDMPKRPVDVYGINKAACENITEVLASVHGFKYTIVRPHNVFGERQHIADPYRNVIGIWINRIMQGEPPIIYGDGKQKRSFTSIYNFAPYALNMLDDKCNGEIINVGPIEEYTLNDACEIILKTMKSSLKPIYVPDRPLEVKYAWSTYNKAQKLLEYKTRVSFEQGIASMVKWARELGPQPFKYLDELEIISKKTPKTWTEKKI